MPDYKLNQVARWSEYNLCESELLKLNEEEQALQSITQSHTS